MRHGRPPGLHRQKAADPDGDLVCAGAAVDAPPVDARSEPMPRGRPGVTVGPSGGFGPGVHVRRGVFYSAHNGPPSGRLYRQPPVGPFLFTVNSASSVLSRLSMQFRSGVAWKVTRLFFYLLAPRLGA
jgi:hypothetical protein